MLVLPTRRTGKGRGYLLTLLLAAALPPAGGVVFAVEGSRPVAAKSPSAPDTQTPGRAAATHTIRVLAEDERGITLEIEIPRPSVRSTAGRLEISLPGFGRSVRTGAPLLPVRAERIAIPREASPSLQILAAESSPLSTGRPAAMPRLIRPNGGGGRGTGAFRAARAEDPEIYSSLSAWPEAPATLGSPGSLRGVPFVDLILQPVRYDPVSESVEHTRRLVVRVDFGGAFASAAGPPAATPAPAADLREDSELPVDGFVNLGLARQLARAEREGLAAGIVKIPTSRYLRATSGSASARYKLTVRRDGVYRLEHAWVQANAPDLLGRDPGRYRITDLDVEIPITVVDQDADGTFEGNGTSPDDYIEFYGQKLTWDILSPDEWQGGDYTDDNIYWLDVSTSPGLRAPLRDGTPVCSNCGPPADFLETIHHEGAEADGDGSVDELFASTIPSDGGDHWVQRPGMSTTNGTPVSTTWSVRTPDPSTATTQASIKVRMLGDNYNRNLHRSNVYIGAKLVDGCGDGGAGCGNEGGGCVDWDGFVWFTHGETNGPVHFCQSDLSATTNVRVELPLGRSDGSGAVNADTAYVDWIEITYGRKFRADADANGDGAADDVLVFGADNATTKFKISGLSTNRASVYEITSTLPDGRLVSPVLITGATFASAGGAWDLTFQINADGALPARRRFIVATSTASGATGDLTPAAVRLYTASDIRNPVSGADWLLIGDADLMDSDGSSGLQRLVAYRRDTQGKRVRTVTVEQIYDEFSYGIFDPQAIRDFLAHAYANWPAGPGGSRLEDVVLLGDATFDMKNQYRAPAKRLWVPTYMRSLSTNSIVGYYSDDVYFARVDGPDELPDIDIGRLPAHSLAEANSICQKILDYDSQARSPATAWQHNAVLTAENKDGRFKASLEAPRWAYIDGSAHTVNKIYMLDLEPSFPNPQDLANETRDRIQRNLNGENIPARDIGHGAAVFAFVGHGSWQNWGRDWSIFETHSSGPDDLTPVTNATKLPFLFISNCLSGGFHVTNRPGNADLTYALSEDFLTTASKGAVAALAPAHLTYLHNLEIEVDAVFREIYYRRKERHVGRIAQALRELFYGNLAYVDMRSYALLADPATTLVLPAPAPPTNVAVTSEGDRTLGLSWTPSPAAASYRIYRASSQFDDYAVVADGVTGSGYTDSAVDNCVTYYYAIVSLDSGGFEGRWSNFNADCPGAGDCVKGTPRRATAPSMPTGVTVSDPETGINLDVSWNPNPPGDETNEYYVRWSPVQADPSPPNVRSLAATSMRIGNLTPGVRYYVTVAASNCSQGEGPRSPEVSGRPVHVDGIKPPRWISDLRVSRLPDPGDGKADNRLDWTLPAVDIYDKTESLAQVRVYHNAAGPQFALDAAHLLATLGPTAISYVHEDAFWDASRHYYLVVAVDVDGYRSGGGHELPRGIDDLRVARAGPSALDMSWSAVGEDLLGRSNPAAVYKLYSSGSLFTRADTPGMSPLLATTGISTSVALPAATTYYSVIAEDARGSETPW